MGSDDGFRWTTKSLKAAQLVAEDDITDRRIAEECGIGHSTLQRWKLNQEFRDRVRQIEEDLEAAVMRLAINRRRKRQAKYDDMARRLDMIVDERSEAYIDQVGGKSGYIVKQKKSVGYGKNTQIVEEVAFDSALFREQRAVMEQAAKEAGQWIEKGEVSGPSGQPLVITEIVIDRTAKPDATDDDDDPEEGS